MPYASLQEAWGVQNNNNTCNGTRINNQFVVPNPNKSQTNLDQFFDKFYRDTNQVTNNYQDESYDTSSKYRRSRQNNSIEGGNPKRSTYRKRKDWCKPEYKDAYFLEDDLSTISDPESDVCSDTIPIKKMIGKEFHMNCDPRREEAKKTIEKKDIHEGFDNFHTCEGIMEHIKKCELCQSQIQSMNQNVFMKEFIIFAASGILMFIFLELIYRIARRQ